MPTQVLVPLLGEGVEEVTITRWLKTVGDSVNELEPLLEVNTDKVDTEIPSPAAGVLLSIHKPEGQPARVGELLAVIGQPGETDAGGHPLAPTGGWAGRRRSGRSPAPRRPAPPVVPDCPLPLSKASGFISPVVARIAATGMA